MSLYVSNVGLGDFLADAKRQAADSQLDGTVALDVFYYEICNLVVYLARLFWRQLCQRLVAAFNYIVDTVEV